jgi:hypothetical protein
MGLLRVIRNEPMGAFGAFLNTNSGSRQRMDRVGGAGWEGSQKFNNLNGATVMFEP